MIKAHIVPQSDNVMVHGNGAALGSCLHAEELQAEGKFKAVSISAILLTPTHLDGSHFSSNDTSIVYICNLRDIRGEFDPRKAKACGLKKGRKLGQLQNGISVKSDLLDIELSNCSRLSFCLILVHPDDAIGPPIPGPIILIVDCPTEPHAQELLSAQTLNAYYSDSESNSPETTKVVNCIIHLSPATVVSSQVYEKWMRKFRSAQHIMARTTRKHETTPILESSARIATRLNYLCPQLFPAPSLLSVQNDDVAAPNFKGSISKVCGISAENLLKFTLRPPRRLGLDRSSVQNQMTSSVFVKKLLSDIPEIADAAKNISTFWHKPKEDEVELYGINGADSAVRNLKCIWISHIHADHHVGLARILALRRDLLKGVPHEPMLVIGPEQVGEFLKDYKKLEDLDMLFLDCRSTTVAKWDEMEADAMFDKDHQMSSEGMNDESRDHTMLTSLSEDSSLLRCSKRMKPSTPVDDVAEAFQESSQ
ncbi:hypothetical protein A4A49_07384 [Nicotiana attenuata]|uniref:ribonuclease Z n=1 Tax=Nicotiana attenuata TaxID=49451 RepID=A0A314KWH4_NICAT|nr:hypothetical protein A4A49_07384 [Nicotiana attenuata]